MYFSVLTYWRVSVARDDDDDDCGTKVALIRVFLVPVTSHSFFSLKNLVSLVRLCKEIIKVINSGLKSLTCLQRTDWLLPRSSKMNEKHDHRDWKVMVEEKQDICWCCFYALVLECLVRLSLISREQKRDNTTHYEHFKNIRFCKTTFFSAYLCK
jgi:hypothetical protein